MQSYRETAAYRAARHLMARVCEELPERPGEDTADPRFRLRHAAVAATLRLALPAPHSASGAVRDLETILNELRHLPDLIDFCRTEGLLPPDKAAELSDLGEDAAAAVATTLASLGPTRHPGPPV